MSFQKHFVFITSFSVFISSIFSGCGGAASNTATNASNAAPTTANSNSGVAQTNADNPFNTTRRAEEATTNRAETIAPVVAAYYEALKKKDDAALRKVYSRETLQSLEKDMKDEGVKSLAAFITELEPAPDKPFEVRNEQVQGDTAVAEMRGGAYPNGIRIKFVRENGEWKMTNESPESDAVKQAANNSPR